MASNPKSSIISRGWAWCRNAALDMMQKSAKEFLFPMICAAGIGGVAGGGATKWIGSIITDEQIKQIKEDLTSIRSQTDGSRKRLDELAQKLDKLTVNFPTTSTFFPKARLKNQGNRSVTSDDCEQVLDLSPGKGISLSPKQEIQLDGFVILVDSLDKKGEKIVLDVEGFASELPFFSSSMKSDKCNLKVANLRAEKVGEYLRGKLLDLNGSVDEGVTIRTKTWDTYTDMDQNRPYLYGPPPSIEPSAGLHVLNQAVYITISSP